ncbi:uncharacterized protein YlxW (UPF0749 family) [Luteococcus japonicus]|uniref:Membrane spanning protein n=2 Tax=Luteococcus japonicus TaxID=33984 RepID=A0A1R4JZG7_9ACTN|nr:MULTISPECIES: DUF881 domain-containing protein [Luteococcus]MDN5563087.1 DUF881 domain-containing protein [Luteococcus sp.]ROR55153.1 uncharacterized protein YlxW (UPF0749 family) [Luteococcus japonicus]SJN37195.1 Membrane spanning protein [Luteococcus japonicus LSP_Lj1]
MEPRRSLPRQGLARRVLRRVHVASLHQRNRPVSATARFASLLVVVLAGAMMAISARTSGGTDLRPDRNQDLVGLVRSQAEANLELQRKVEAQRNQVDALGVSTGGEDATGRRALEQANKEAGLTPVKGPAMRVTLTDAPLSVKPMGIDEDLLVVHQQDIQMVVNVLWAAGAEAMTIQGQRVTSLTGIKCVGNTVVLRGVPYAPPYVITAIGDPARLEAALATSKEVAVYKEYVDAYRLGWKQERLAQVRMPGYTGSLALEKASVER